MHGRLKPRWSQVSPYHFRFVGSASGRKLIYYRPPRGAIQSQGLSSPPKQEAIRVPIDPGGDRRQSTA